MNTNQPKRLLELDALRGIAALVVILFHYTYSYYLYFGKSHFPVIPFRFGFLGVQLFFVISGFVIYMTLEKTKSVKDFVIARFARIYPTYWGAMLLTFTVLYFSDLPTADLGWSLGWRELLVNFTLMQKWFGIHSVDGVYWSLAVELVFYVYMVIIYAKKQLKNIETIGIIWVLVKALAYFAKFPYSDLIKSLLLLDFINLFFAGILFYHLKTQGSTLKRHAYIFICYIVALGSAYKSAHEITSLSFMTAFAIIALIMALVFGSFYLLVYNRLFFINNKVLLFLGVISYPLYLTHQMIGFATMHALGKIQVSPIISMVITASIAFLLAVVLHYLIEIPARKFIMRKYFPPKLAITTLQNKSA